MLNHQNNIDSKIYNYDEKKKLVYRIQNIKSKKNYFKLYSIITNEDIKFTKNNNGFFFNINKLSNNSLKIIENFLDKLDLRKELINDSDMSNNESETLISTEDNVSSSINYEIKENFLKKKILD